MKNKRFLSAISLLFIFVISALGQPESNLVSDEEEQILSRSGSYPVGKIDDEFSVTPLGQVNYEIPIPTFSGTGGIAPKLSITYNSSKRSSLMGFGFDLTGLSIINRTPSNRYNDGIAGLIDFTSSDHYSLDGARLILVNNGQACQEYKTEEDSYSKIVAYGNVANPDSFVVKTKSGLKYTYISSRRIIDNTSTEVGLFWMVTKVEDTCGNYYTVQYVENGAGSVSLPNHSVCPSRIDYTGNSHAGLAPYASVRFLYENNSIDSCATYISGKLVMFTKRLKRIDIYSSETKVRSFEASYTTNNYRSFLSQISEIAQDGTRKKPTTFEWNTVVQPNSSYYENNDSYIHNARLTVGDYNGDGKADFLATPMGTDAGWQGWRLYVGTNENPVCNASGLFTFDYDIKDIVSGDFNGDGYDDFAVLRFFPFDDEPYVTTIYYTEINNGTISFNSPTTNFYSSSRNYSLHKVEITGDGMADLLLSFDSYGDYKTIFSSAGTPLTQIVTGLSPTGGRWNKLETIDFNGDGLTDLYLDFDNSAYFLKPQNNGTFSWSPVNHLHSYDWIPGDFNGDGKTDFLATSSHGVQMGLWHVFMSDGTGNLLSKYYNGLFNTLNYNLYPCDINGDGYDDFYAIPKTSGNSVAPVKAYINNGTGYFFETSAGFSTYSVDKWYFYLGDFRGNGKTDLLCTSNWAGSNWDGFKYYSSPNTGNLLLTKITDAFDYSTEIEYASLPSGPHIRGNINDYPVTSFSAPWPVVNRIATSNGIGGKRWVKYSYENALIHRDGRGILGFEKVSKHDYSDNTTTISEYAVEPHKFVMGLVHTETRIGSRKVQETFLQYDTLNVNQSVFTYQPIATTEKTYDYSSGELLTEVRTTTEYDVHGNITKLVSNNGDIRTTTNNEYSDDDSRWILGRLIRSTVTKVNATDSCVKHSEFSYDASTGLLTVERVEPDNDSLGYRKVYVHDVFGNIVRDSIQPNSSNSQARITATTYDAKGRYIISTTNALGHTTSFDIDSINGLRRHTTDANGITTTYQYDSFGRLEREDTPIETASTIFSWSPGTSIVPSTACYIVTKSRGGMNPVIKEYYDCLGRLVRTITTSIYGDACTDIDYNIKGQIERKSEPYYLGEQEPVWNTFEYDNAGRMRAQTDAAGATTTYTYNGFTTIVTDALGHTVSRTTDRNGHLVRSTDQDGVSVTYQYNVEGNCTQVTGPRTTISMQYDKMGNRISLDDPDLGESSSVYNAYGELVSQTDSKGTTNWTYDLLGRAIREQRPDVTTVTVYDTSFIGAPTSITCSNGTGTIYHYDAFGRTTIVENIVDNISFETRTSYNAYNKVDTLTYHSGLQVKYRYSAYGDLESIENANTEATIWQADSVTARGLVAKQTYGNGLITHTGYNPLTGRLNSISTTGIQNWSYGYDALGNLTQRKDIARNLTETFEYDNLSRLVGVKRNGILTQKMTYDAAGNLTSKTGVGHDFVYQDGTNRLISYYADSPRPRLWDDVQYNSFHKVASIEQGDDMLTLTYGPDKSRVKAVLTNEGLPVETKYYVGNLYEESRKQGGVVQFTNYIFAGNLCVAMQEQTYRPGETGTTRMLYLHHDHLGSVQAYSDEQGHLLQEMSYDAWGLRRNPATWNGYERQTEANAQNPWGFGGHEHLDLFELVNMDGRMYDPVLGRFLSPDPYVQAPEYTQSLNRYIYCLNNPLSLTDPTGYNWFTDNWKEITATIVGITVAALTAGISSGVTAAIIAGAAGGAAGALTGALLNGANLSQTIKGTFTGAFWGAASGFFNFASGDGTLLEKLFKHALSSGWLEGVQGGNMLHGLMMGAVSGAGGHYIDKYAGSIGKVGEIASNAVLSGTIDELGGGKFANGAITGAYSMMFNDLMHPQNMTEQRQATKKDIEADGALSIAESYTWWGIGNGETLEVDVNSLNLDFIDVSNKKPGDVWSVSLEPGGKHQWGIYGDVKVGYLGDNKIVVFPDVYDFDIKPNPLNKPEINRRNRWTKIDKIIHGEGVPYIIVFKGIYQLK